MQISIGRIAAAPWVERDQKLLGRQVGMGYPARKRLQTASDQSLAMPLHCAESIGGAAGERAYDSRRAAKSESRAGFPMTG